MDWYFLKFSLGSEHIANEYKCFFCYKIKSARLLILDSIVFALIRLFYKGPFVDPYISDDLTFYPHQGFNMVIILVNFFLSYSWDGLKEEFKKEFFFL